MTREEHSEAAQTASEDRVAKAWDKPRVTRFSAGSAEDGAGAVPDAGINPS